MSLHIYIAHTGEQMLADPVSFASPDALRTWISRHTQIPVQRQILMTAKGKSVKTQSLATEDEIYVYDRQNVSEQTSNSAPEGHSPPLLTLQDPPDVLADRNNLQSWKDLFMARRSWALNLAAHCNSMAKSVDDHHTRIDVIRRGVAVARENLKSHVGNLEHKFQDTHNWANELVKDQRSALKDWQRAYQDLSAIPAKSDFTFLRRPTPKKPKAHRTGTLQDYIDAEELQNAVSQVSSQSQRFSRRVDDLEKEVRDISSQAELLDNATSNISAKEVEQSLLEEIERHARKITSDYTSVLALPNDSGSISSVSKIALVHTKKVLPKMADTSRSLRDTLSSAIKDLNTAMKDAAGQMQKISSIELRLAKTQADIAELNVETDAFDVLCLVYHLPSIYGSILIESARRYEWTDKMKTDSRDIAEELAIFRDEEQRRRKKWAKRMGDFLNPADDSAPSVEVNLQAAKDAGWPEVSRAEIEEYIELIEKKDGMEDAVQELKQLFKELDTPTRQQRRRTKAFKQGSLFEMGRSSFLLRDNDVVRSLQEEKSKVEERLKGSESRVRRLEDLLHRQSHISRPVSGQFGPEIPTSPASPRLENARLENASRRSSMSSRRMSSNQPQDDRALIQRIVALEAELAVERDALTKMQRETSLERQSNVDKIEEAELTKKDLMKNLEAKQREFDEERRFLESEGAKFKARIEELEDELDRAMDSHDHERHELDEKFELLYKELETARGRGQEDATTQARLSKLTDRNNELEDQIQSIHRVQKDLVQGLQSAYHNASNSTPPNEIKELVDALCVVVEGLAIHSKGSDEALAELSKENDNLNQKIAQMEEDAKTFGEKLELEREKNSSLQKQFNDVKAEMEEANAKLEKEQKETASLKSALGSEKDKTQTSSQLVTEGERKIAELNERVQRMEKDNSSITAELLEWKQKAETVHADSMASNSWFDARGSRAGDMSVKVHTLVEQLSRILEELGFTIVTQDNSMTIQRTSRVMNGLSVGDSMSSSTLIRTIPTPEHVHWAKTGNEDDESSQFSSFMAAIDRMDIAACADAVIKRVKDIETLARKWQKEARGYRDKYHRAQSEAHDKIAYRSFKAGDLALFLPTRNQEIRSWAAFNVGAPHYFLREQEVHKLHTRDWLLARITKAEERVVDLSKSMNGANHDRLSTGGNDGASIDDDNPFELSDGLRWYLLDASEEKPRAPSTPGLGKSTVASAHVDAKGSIRLKRAAYGGGATKTLSKSLDSRRNSSASRNGAPIPTLQPASTSETVLPSDGDQCAESRREEAQIFDEVRRDLLSGPSNESNK
ncbi:oligomeric, coiled-coil, peripheral membrane protein [Microsporum canis]|uniref:Autophagy-related protein 11 n=1 Tax=Arthroderma otae (strain ATCC MYA-4605 / CBS 113480) TaxID=554155 RepID=C5FS80_ARTOC|nr:Atg11p [Microsporum canis CBS 113480]EEQ32733.1 Atg11p [Microsporum canis CBS 113480]